MIDLGRLERIIQGIEEPENKSEEVFLLAYATGVSGELLVNLCLGASDMLDEFDLDQWQFFVMGYAWGQKDGAEVMEHFSDGNGKTKIH